MNTETPATYTTEEAMQALGLSARSAFHHLRNRYPKAFIVVTKGSGRTHPTTYDKSAIDQFATWRNQYKDQQS